MHTINPYEALTEDIILEKLNKFGQTFLIM